MNRARLSVAVIAATAVGGALAWQLRPPPPGPELQVFDVRASEAGIARDFPGEDGHVAWYYGTHAGSAHLHVLGPHIVCQLHLHQKTEEVSIPVVGRPFVAQAYPGDGGVQLKMGTYDEGTLVLSPPDCAHEWSNAKAAEDHGALVFTFGDSFTDNEFVELDNPLIQRGAPPTVVDVGRELEAFRASPEALRRIDLPLKLGSVATYLIKGDLPLHPEGKRAALIYTARGSGSIEGLAVPVALHPGVLAILRTERTPTIRANAADPLAIAVVHYLR